MSQTFTLTAPIVPTVPPSTIGYELGSLFIARKPFPRVVIVVVDNNGNTLQVEYRDDSGGTVAAQLISALNTANLTIKSLQQHILERLQADGRIGAGAVSGVPD